MRKLNIKSFLIGVLATTNFFFFMGFKQNDIAKILKNIQSNISSIEYDITSIQSDLTSIQLDVSSIDSNVDNLEDDFEDEFGNTKFYDIYMGIENSTKGMIQAIAKEVVR